MDDPVLVRGFECLGDLPRDGECFVDRKRALRDPLGQRRAFDQLQDQRADRPVSSNP